MTRVRRILVQLLPWAVALGVAGMIVQQYSLQAIFAEMSAGRSGPLFWIAPVMLAGTLFVVGAADFVTIRAHSTRARYLEVVCGKAASVLLDLINYAAGKGGYGAWIARKYGVGVGISAGLVVYIMAADLFGISVVATLAIWIGQPDLPPAVGYIFAAISATLLLFVLLGPIDQFRLDRFSVFHPWTRTPVGVGLLQMFLRITQQAVFVVVTWLAAEQFGLDVPPAVMLAYFPVIAITGALPINVAGIGAVQGAWLLLEPWAPAEQILAFSLVWGWVLSGFVVLRGLPFVNGVLRDLRYGTAVLDGD